MPAESQRFDRVRQRARPADFDDAIGSRDVGQLYNFLIPIRRFYSAERLEPLGFCCGRGRRDDLGILWASRRRPDRSQELLALSGPGRAGRRDLPADQNGVRRGDARLIPPSIARSVRSACSASGSGRCRARPIWRRAGRRRGAGVPRPGSEPDGTRSRSPSIAATRTNRA